MSLKTSMWVHGTIAEVEDATGIAKTARMGWGTSFTGKPGKLNWFHFPITTPAILDDIQPLLVKVYVFYFSDQSKGSGVPVIRNVQLYDGSQKIKSFDNLDLSGDHGSKQDAQNSWAVDPPIKINHGLGVSVRVEFPTLTKPPDVPISSMDILFTAVGADFRKP
jgi:hypothetical protein